MPIGPPPQGLNPIVIGPVGARVQRQFRKTLSALKKKLRGFDQTGIVANKGARSSFRFTRGNRQALLNAAQQEMRRNTIRLTNALHFEVGSMIRKIWARLP